MWPRRDRARDGLDFAGERKRRGIVYRCFCVTQWRAVVANSASLLYIGEYFFKGPQPLGVRD